MSPELGTSMKPKCQHRVKSMGYMGRLMDDERRMKLGQKQLRCPVCKLWFWESEFRKRKKP